MRQNGKKKRRKRKGKRDEFEWMGERENNEETQIRTRRVTWNTKTQTITLAKMNGSSYDCSRSIYDSYRHIYQSLARFYVCAVSFAVRYTYCDNTFYICISVWASVLVAPTACVSHNGTSALPTKWPPLKTYKEFHHIHTQTANEILIVLLSKFNFTTMRYDNSTKIFFPSQATSENERRIPIKFELENRIFIFFVVVLNAPFVPMFAKILKDVSATGSFYRTINDERNENVRQLRLCSHF